MNNTFSIIIPSYNEEENILKTLSSIAIAIKNNESAYEIIIVDGNSKDKTLEVAKDYLQNSNVAYEILSHNEMLYPGKARNIGIKNSKYDKLIFIDCGITITKDFINECQNKIEFFDILWFDSQFQFSSEVQRSYIRSYFVRGKNKRYIRHFSVKKEVLTKIGYFREDLRAAEDWIFYLYLNKYSFNELFSEVTGYYSGYPKNFITFYKKWVIYFEHSVYANLHKKNIITSFIQFSFIGLEIIVFYLLLNSILISIVMALLLYIGCRTYISFFRSKIKCVSFTDLFNTVISSMLLEASRIIGVVKGVRKHE